MPPLLSRKRLRSDSPNPTPPPTKRRNATQRRNNVFQTLDAPPKVKRTLSQTKALLEQDADDDSDLSSPESSEDDDFEDVPINVQGKAKSRAYNAGETSDSQEDEWEDAMQAENHPAPVISGDIALTLSAAPKTAFEDKPDGKKGPSKVQRQIRSSTHCIHVQCLVFHNLMRNAWIQDREVQKILVQGLPWSCWREIDQYWRDSGIPDGSSRAIVPHPPTAPTQQPKSKGKTGGTWRESSRNGVQIFENPLAKASVAQNHSPRSVTTKDRKVQTDRNARDWGATSEPVEPTTPNLSAGDPLLRLLRYLAAHWKSKFKVTSPTLRKRGYLPPSTLEAEINAWRKSPSQAEFFGERIDDIEAFREKARLCEGSRDLGNQLFTALLRGLGIEARMIVSLQPVGFGFSQAEEGKARNLDKLSAQQQAATVPKQKLGRLPQRGVTRDRVINLDSKSSDDSDLSSVISISSDTDQEISYKKPPKARNYTEELPYPTYWTEAISPLTHTPVAVSSLSHSRVASTSASDKLENFYARGGASDRAKQVFAYVIAFSSDGTAKDVTTRYLPKRQWPGRTKGFRMPAERIPIYNKRGKVKHWEEWDWFKSVMRSYARSHHKRQPWDEVEDEGDLVPVEPQPKKVRIEEGGKESLQGYKNSAEYVLERHLRREEALRPGAKIVRHFVMGKGDKETSEPVYLRKDIVQCKTVESWHKEGREVQEGEQPLKFVPMRAVTVTRKREIEERERDEGQKPKQGLYAKSQTNWIIPPPIVDGKIPRNAFNNIDVYVPTMVPSGAVHIPLKGTARICRKLNIDHAEACTGFEFGKQRAVPIITGVVVAAENESAVIDAWEADEAEKVKKEADKREKMVLGMWKKFLSGLRIVERMRVEYGDDIQLPNKDGLLVTKPIVAEKQSDWETFKNQTNFEGGFVRDENAYEPSAPAMPSSSQGAEHLAGGFLVPSQEDPIHSDLIVDHGDNQTERDRPSRTENYHHGPISLTSAIEKPREAPNEISNEERGDLSVSDEDVESSTIARPPAAQGASKSPRTGKQPAKRCATMAPTALRQRQRTTVETTMGIGDQSSSKATRSVPKRKAAKKSEAQIKSHFFTHESNDETDLTDLTDRASPKKVERVRKGTRSGRKSTKTGQ